MAKNLLAKVGVWAFIMGMIVAIVAGFLESALTTPILVAVGILVGLLNVSEKEAKGFLLAAVSIMIAVYTAGGQLSNLATLGAVGDYLKSLMMNINVFVFPATIVVAVRAIYALAKD
jgi:hypothetical protein